MNTEPNRVVLSRGRRLLVCDCRKDRQYPTPEKNEILVIDDRMAKDPSFQVRDSYRIGKRAEREEILNALIAYAAEHPIAAAENGHWQRTVSSMEREWMLHNIAYALHILRSSSMHVDLNNAEEKGSLRYYAIRIIGIVWRRVKRLCKR